MKSVHQARACIPCHIFILLTILVLFMTKASHANTLKDLSTRLPKQLKHWTAEPRDRLYDEETIYSYIDGGAELYKAYNMRRCLSRRYTTTKGPSIILDIFDMGTSDDAFGVFTHDTDGNVIDIGQDARYRSGWLSFWKHRYFVSIYMEEETVAAEKAVKALGREVAAHIAEKGFRPRILQKLPSEGLVSGSVRYLHHPIVLNYHFYISDENILNLSAHTEAILANYKMGPESARLFLISYTNLKVAKKSLKDFLKHYLPDADKTGFAEIENGKFAAAFLKDKLLTIILESDSRRLAERLLAPFL
ncbi:MAG: hypothetical protein PVG15_02700 [Desulfobacterales bacterium]|jgi:hypothetical protein